MEPRAPAYRTPHARRIGDGASTTGGASSTTVGTSVASRAAASLVDGTGGEDGPSTVLVTSAGGAEDLVRAEAQLSSKLRDAIRAGGAGRKGRRGAPAAGSKGTDQVARSLAKRRQARLEMARLRSSSAFVDWLWLGNTDRPDRIAKTIVPPGAAGPRLPADGKTAPSTRATDAAAVPFSSGAGASAAAGAGVFDDDDEAAAAAAAAAEAASPAAVRPADESLTPAAAAAAGVPGTGRSTTPKQWTGAGDVDGRVRRVKAGPMRPRRGSMGATAVDKILSEFDKHRAEADGGGAAKRRGAGARGVRGGGRIKAMGKGAPAGAAGATAAGATASGATGSAKPKNEQAPERGNIKARLAARRRHLPDGGCARCWAVSTRCCYEAMEMRRAKLEVQRQGLVLTGRAQEAVEVLGLTNAQLKRLHKHFVEMDDSLEGRIHLNDFFEEFLEMPRSAVTDAIWLALVENTTGQMLGFEDFVLIVCVYCMFTEEDILRFCFSTFDINGNGDLDEDEFLQMLRIVNHEKPLFPGNFKSALEQFDSDANGVITFDEFLTMHYKFPQLLWPLFQLQDRMQHRSLGRYEWAKISRHDQKMRAANASKLKSKEAAVADAQGLARIEELEGEEGEAAAAAGAASVAGSGASGPSPATVSRPAPGQRLAGGDMSGLAMRSASTSKRARSKERGRKGGGRRQGRS